MRVMIALLLLLSAMAMLALLMLGGRETEPHVTNYAIETIRRDTANGNPPNYTGSPEDPGYGKPNVSPDVARRYGGRVTTAPAETASTAPASEGR